MTLDELLQLVLDGRGRYDGEEAVDDLAHALQTAALAVEAGATADLVGAALLHDVGHHPVLVERFGLVPHEKIGAAVIGPVLGERAAYAVQEHVAAKRHLVATDPTYPLSAASRESLERQGGPAVLAHLLNGYGPDALALRRWDDLAKVVDAPELDWDDLVALISPATLAEHPDRG